MKEWEEELYRYRLTPEPLGLTFTRYPVMTALWVHGGMTEGRSGRILRHESGTLAGMETGRIKTGSQNRKTEV